MAKYKEPDVDQTQIVVLNFSELFPEDHPTNKLLKIINKLDLSMFDENYANDIRGRLAFPVDRLLAILFYSILHGNISMRDTARDIRKRADLLYLSGGLGLDHSTLSIFRNRHCQAIEELFNETVFLGAEAGFINFETVCIDSTKMKGNANRKDIGKADDLQMRYEKSKKNSQHKYKEWLKSGDTEDKKALRRTRERLARNEDRLLAGLNFLKENKNRKRVHLTDRDADYHKNGDKGFIIGYKAHVSVDTKTRMIVDKQVVTQQPDSPQTVELVEQVETIKANAICKKSKNKKVAQTKYVLDAGYASESNLERLSDKDIYMPDAEYATQIKENWDKREHKRQEDYPDIEFRYNKKGDKFICPNGPESDYKEETNIR